MISKIVQLLTSNTSGRDSKTVLLNAHKMEHLIKADEDVKMQLFSIFDDLGAIIRVLNCNESKK